MNDFFYLVTQMDKNGIAVKTWLFQDKHTAISFAKKITNSLYDDWDLSSENTTYNSREGSMYFFFAPNAFGVDVVEIKLWEGQND